MKSFFPLFVSLVLSTLFICSEGSAQSLVQGTVINEQGHPIPYATISINNKTANQHVQQADSLGHFSFKEIKNIPIQLSIYAFGYNQKQTSFPLQKDTALVISLQPLNQKLKEVTITGAKASILRKTDRVVFNVSENISTAGSNGLNILKKIPGIHASNQTISLAGKGSMGIMVNGRMLHLSDKALANYLRSFGADRISQIEVITHPGAQYEAEGSSGLINIITKKNHKQGWGGTLSGFIKRFFYHNQPDYKGIDNYGDLNGSLNLHYNDEKWSLYTNLNYTAGRELWGYGIGVHYPDQFWDMGDTGEYRIATFNGLAGANYKLSNKTTIGAEYNYVYHLEEGADYVKVPIYNNSGSMDSLLKTFATYLPIAKSNAFNLHLNQKLNESGATMTLNADYFNYFRIDHSNLITKGYTPAGKFKPGTIKKLYDTTLQNIKIYTFKADFVYPTSFARLAFGGKVSFINNYSNIYYFHKNGGKLAFDSSLSNEFRYIENTQSLYMNAAKNLNKWKLEAGLRAEFTQTKATSYFQNTMHKGQRLRFFPSVLATYLPNQENQFSLTYNRRIHRPTFWNLNPYKTFMTAYTYVEGNPYLEPEYTTNIQFTHNYKKKFISSIYTNINDNGFAQVIVPQNEGQYTHVTKMLNFFRSYNYGMSESISLTPFSWWQTQNLLRAYYTEVKSNIPYIAGINGWGGYLSTNNTFYFNNDKSFSGFLGFWYQFPEIDRFGRSTSYYSVNAGLQYLALQKKLTLSLNFNDIFQSSASAVTSTVRNMKTTYTNFQLNSQLRLSAVWQFGSSDLEKAKNNTGNEAERSRL
ncbi:MAG TPA: outer membrane beta-barrel protein [Chitinophagaceae bacterium]|nr:outer membrane beta-barrel protein [Chitinophagaceae bacterium]